MLSNKIKVIVLLTTSLIISCSDKKENVPQFDFENKTQVIDVLKKHFNNDVETGLSGMFDESGKQLLAAGREISNSDEWGIKFAFLEKKGSSLELLYETDILEGSFKESFFDKIKISPIDYDLLYYNSAGYYLGSGGGEVFCYLVDLVNKQVYYAHLVVESESSISLFISENTDKKEIKNFFILNFKKDYPNLTIVEDEIILE